MKVPYLGEIPIHWCSSCNVPLLGKTCGICSSESRKLSVSPPGDTRPAFEYDLELIRKAISKQFGKEAPAIIPKDKTVLLNKVPHTNRMYEIFVDGEIIGLLRFDSDWVFVPKLEGVRRILQLSKSKLVKIPDDVEPFLLDGKSLLAVGIDSMDKSIKLDDYVIVEGPNTIAVGISKLPKLIKIKEISEQKGPSISSKASTWETAAKANEKILGGFEKKAVSFIKKTAEENHLPATVAFSGGKDSLVVYLLAQQALESFTTIFNNTGLEFPETVDYVNEFPGVIICSAGEKFWEEIKTFGPPARDYRWCCKVCKLGPISQTITEKFPTGVLSFEGTRKYESFQRHSRPKIDRNHWMPNQLSAYPIRDWTSLHVWLYIFSKHAKYNPLYEQGYDRVGCWLCPASSLSELTRLKGTHPQLWKKYLAELEDYKDELGYPDEYISEAKWRWKRGDRALSPTKQPKQERLSYSFVSGVSPCKVGGFVVEGKFSGALDIERTSNILQILGTVKYSDSLGTLLLKSNHFTYTLFQDSTFKLNTDKKEAAEKDARQVSDLVLRASACVGCGLCLPKCKSNALHLEENRIAVGECTHCLACLDVSCPVLKFTKN